MVSFKDQRKRTSQLKIDMLPSNDEVMSSCSSAIISTLVTPYLYSVIGEYETSTNPCSGFHSQTTTFLSLYKNKQTEKHYKSIKTLVKIIFTSNPKQGGNFHRNDKK